MRTEAHVFITAGRVVVREATEETWVVRVEDPERPTALRMFGTADELRSLAESILDALPAENATQEGAGDDGSASARRAPSAASDGRTGPEPAPADRAREVPAASGAAAARGVRSPGGGGEAA